MPKIPVDRATTTSREEHVADHNELHRLHNRLVELGETGEGIHNDHTYLDPTGDSAILPPPILTSPNGSHYRLKVSNDGVISTDFVAYDPVTTGRSSGTGYMSESGERLISSTSYAFKGDPITPEEPFTVTALSTDVELVAGGQYRGYIVTGDTAITGILGISGIVTAASTGLGSITLPFSPAIALPAGQEVHVLTGRIDAGDGHVYPVDAYDGSRAGFTWQAIPASDVGYSCSRVVSATPAVGQALNRGKGYNAAPFNIRIDWTQV